MIEGVISLILNSHQGATSGRNLEGLFLPPLGLL